MDSHNLNYGWPKKTCTGCPNLVYWEIDYLIGSKRPMAHGGGAVNVAWVDGHVSWMQLTTLWNKGDYVKYFGKWWVPD